MKIYALIPIKHISERVKGKNYRIFNGKPLCYWIINSLLNSKYINKIIIDTDSEMIKKIINELFVDQIDKILLYDRPEFLQGGDVPTNDLFMNVIKTLNLDADLYFQTHTTNPLLKTSTINNAIETYKNLKNKDSLFSAKKHFARFYNNKIIEMNHNRFNLIPTQNLDPIYEENSCMYIFTKESLFRYKSRIGKNPYIYEMSDIESSDIDWPEDFELAEILHSYYVEQKSNTIKEE